VGRWTRNGGLHGAVRAGRSLMTIHHACRGRTMRHTADGSMVFSQVEFLKLLLDLLNSRRDFRFIGDEMALPDFTSARTAFPHVHNAVHENTRVHFLCPGCIRHLDCYTEICVLVRGECGAHKLYLDQLPKGYLE
jgi:hypothetical protein